MFSIYNFFPNCADVRLDLDRIEDAGLIAAVNAVYPEAVPVGKARSIFDAA